MTAPVFFADTASLGATSPGEIVVVLGAEAHHADVQRLHAGERVDLIDGLGFRARCIVIECGKTSLTVQVVRCASEPAKRPYLRLVQALAKSDRDLQAVELATELGLDEAVPWQADRSIVQWRGARTERGLAKWTDLTRAATKQSRRSRTPLVLGPVSVANLADRATAWAAAGPLIVLDEQGDIRAGELLGSMAAAQEVTIVGGPEGGISPRELAALANAGAAIVRLGEEVLRSSSAGPALIAAIAAVGGRWGSPRADIGAPAT